MGQAVVRSPEPMSVRHRVSQRLALYTFVLAVLAAAAVHLSVWSAILKTPGDNNHAPYLIGGFVIAFIAIFWVLLAALLKTLMGRPNGRWVAMGWASLTLVGIYPLLGHYRHYSEPGEATLNARILNL